MRVEGDRRQPEGVLPRLPQLRLVLQAPDRVPGLRARPEAQDGRGAGGDVRAGVNQVLLRAPSQLQPVALAKALCQQDVRQVKALAALQGAHRPDEAPVVGNALRVDQPRVLTPARVPLREPPGKHPLHRVLAVPGVEGLTPFGGVQRLPVGVGHDAHVLRALEPTLDLEAAGAGGQQLGQPLQQVEVPHRQQRAFLPAVGVAEPAGLGAAPAVAAAAADVGGEQALPADADALRAVDEDLGLDARVRDRPDVFQAAFPRQHDAGHAQFPEQQGAMGVVDAHLRAGVHAQLRELLLDQGQQAQVLHDEGVRPPAGQLPQQGLHLRPFRLFDERVDGHVHAPAVKVGEADGPRQVFVAESGACPRAEGGGAQVHGVRARADRGPQRVHAAGGRQQLRPRLHPPPAFPPAACAGARACAGT